MQKKCFVIGPMNEQHMPILNWLAHDIVAPIVKADDFVVETPDIPQSGNIMNHVIKACDRAQLVIADTTGNNPNVLYEMAVLDAMGRPCVPVKIASLESNEEPMAFDRAQYRYFTIYRDKPEDATRRLTAVIEEILKAQESGNFLSNPLTDYFKVPLSSFSSAYGAARGYYYNLIVPAIEGEITNGPPYAKGHSSLRLECVIPTFLDYATRGEIDELVVEQKVFIPVEIKAPGRTVHTYVWPESDKVDKPVLVDVPTTIGALRSNAIARLGPGTDITGNRAEFNELQKDEARQFARYLNKIIEKESNPNPRKRVRLLTVAQTLLKDLWKEDNATPEELGL
jgi:hypothetical protein